MAGYTGEFNNVASSVLSAWRSEVTSLLGTMKPCQMIKYGESFTLYSQAIRQLQNWSAKVTHNWNGNVPSTTSPMKMENLVFWFFTACIIECASEGGVSHPRLPIGPAEDLTEPVWSAYFLQQMGFVQLDSASGLRAGWSNICSHISTSICTV